MKSAVIMTQEFNRIITATKDFLRRPLSNGEVSSYEYIRLEFIASSRTVTAIAVDGYRMSVEKAACEEVTTDFTVYVKGNIHLPKDKFVTVALHDKRCDLQCEEFVFGYEQPDGIFMDWQKTLQERTTREPVLKIGFNVNYLIKALQAAKVSRGSSTNKPVVLEFYGKDSPIFINADTGNTKMVLPVRIKDC